MAGDSVVEVAVVGNPNCGKTTLFNGLTGARQRVGNWSGVTVERKSGFFTIEDKTIELVDLPGTFSLTISDEHVSLDEKIACEYLISHAAKVVINVVDASHLERSLYVSMQLLEMGLPIIIAVNMLDVAKSKGITIDLPALETKLGCPVVGIQANRKRGLKPLRQKIVQLGQIQHMPTFKPRYSDKIEMAIDSVMEGDTSYQRWLGIRLLEGDKFAEELADPAQCQRAKEQLQQLEEEEDVDILLADGRYQQIYQCLDGCYEKSTAKHKNLVDKIDKVVLHRFFGVPIFLAIMYLMFLFAINVGTALQDFFQISSETIFIHGLSHVLQTLHFPQWFIAIVASGIGMGISTTVTFIPVIGGMFFFLSFLESSGYMARAAFVTDRAMRALGLPGKSFVPLIVGFGCNVPSVMAARTLENHRDRVITIMMSPFMSCGARLAIYAVFVAAFFPVNGQNIIFLLYLIGIATAVLTGWILRKTVLAGEHSPLIMELPPYHVPHLGSLLISTWHRLKNFIFRAGKVIIPLCVIIGFLNAFTWQGDFVLGDAHQGSLLSSVGKTITPIFEPMGIHEDNWPATVGLATGLVAKEVVVATLNTLYSQVGHLSNMAGASDFDFWAGIREAALSIPENLTLLMHSLAHPLQALAPESEMTTGVYGEMALHFASQAAAFAYLLFLLLYFPCVSTTAAMLRELNYRWALFSIVWTTGIAYMTAVIFYQVATLMQHPYQTVVWIITCMAIIAMIIWSLRRYSSESHTPTLEAQ